MASSNEWERVYIVGTKRINAPPEGYKTLSYKDVYEAEVRDSISRYTRHIMLDSSKKGDGLRSDFIAKMVICILVNVSSYETLTEYTKFVKYLTTCKRAGDVGLESMNVMGREGGIEGCVGFGHHMADESTLAELKVRREGFKYPTEYEEDSEFHVISAQVGPCAVSESVVLGVVSLQRNDPMHLVVFSLDVHEYEMELDEDAVCAFHEAVLEHIPEVEGFTYVGYEYMRK